MGLAKRLKDLLLGQSTITNAKTKRDSVLRRCHFEVMEPRRVLSADPVVAGVTYHEGDAGQDTTPDHFEVTFQGGAATTQLTTFTINGDQDLSGTLTDGDMFFDFADGGPGAGNSHPFIFDASASRGVTAADIESVTFGTDGLSLTVNVRNFEAGDKLAFTIDVDEVEGLRQDKIASGVEFEGSFFSSTFVDQNYTFSPLSVTASTIVDNQFEQDQTSGIFYDYYDDLISAGSGLAGNDLELRANHDQNQGDRSAASIDVYELIPKPVTISGTVYHDENLNCELDANESGIANVSLTLQKLNETTGRYENVATTKTAADGTYLFGADNQLTPGTYRVVEQQPDGYLDVAASAGTVEGTSVGKVANDIQGNENVLTNIEIPLGGTHAINYDFKEVRPASIAGNVWHDRDNDGVMDPGEEGISNVLIAVTRVGAKDSTIKDPFADTGTFYVRTDSNGHYSVDSLPPGIYEVVEINNYPAGADPLAAYVDGKDSVGTIGGTRVGTGSNDRVTQIELCADDAGIEYNFGEIKPTSISGYVSIATPEGNCVDPDSSDFNPLAGVTLELFDAQGNLVGTTQTDDAGHYEFNGLAIGTYTVVEVQPNGYLDGDEHLGSVAGASNGSLSQNDRFDGITLASGQAGVMYNFCEHIPAEICGTVWFDANDNGVIESGEQRLGGVVVELYDADGNMVAETRTDAEGKYCFQELYAGTYCVKEIQPNGFVDGKDSVGKVDGIQIGDLENDELCNITVLGGQKGTEYNFGEIRLSAISGQVFADSNGDCHFDASAGDEPIANVTMILYDADGVELERTKTDADGNYSFNNLRPGNYSVREIQPNGYIDSEEMAGKVNNVTIGDVTNDRISNIYLSGGHSGTKYDFCEVMPAQLSGYVHLDIDGDCEFDPGTDEVMLSGVTLQLLDDSGKVIATTTTNNDGFYQFTNLEPGTYSVRQVQPNEYFDLGSMIGEDSKGGAATGSTSESNIISGIEIAGGQRLEQYNFCECPPSEIAGRVWEDGPEFETANGNLPSDYRSQRDGVYTAGVDKPIAGVTMKLYYYFDQNGNINPTPVTLADVLPGYYSNLGTNPSTPISVVTDANGNYSFKGIKAGNYIVVQEQPTGYFDSNDAAGSTTGFTYNSQVEAQVAQKAFLSTFSTSQVMDSVVNIRVNAGGISVQNNFTEVRVQQSPTTPTNPLQPIPPTRPPGNPTPPGSPLAGYPGLAGSQPGIYTRFIGTSHGAAFQMASSGGDPYTWHLSVVNAGQPRAAEETDANQTQWLQAAYLSGEDWNRFDMDDAIWSFSTRDGDLLEELAETKIFGTLTGIPLAGDFDGDGIDEVAVYENGYWMIDLNHNGSWDQYDLMAKLGDEDDSPVVGDWDGDGKDDIGIYGPIWELDSEAIVQEPGLPNPDNNPYTKAKNVPPNEVDRTNGARIMKLTAFGKQRADVIDHVFGIDDHRYIPVTGDWNGNGIRSIGTFENGSWRLDVNGDGKFDGQDAFATFGQAGDVPIVGDWDGDGIEQIAVYRAGTWILDSNNNQQIDEADQRIEYGDANARPVAGDWDGDGTDDVGLYRGNSNAR
ncbi:MAG: SdrD B-like domain-containing protein [Pirellulaceae bacterium]